MVPLVKQFFPWNRETLITISDKLPLVKTLRGKQLLEIPHSLTLGIILTLVTR